MNHHPAPTHYFIRVRGLLGDRLLTAFPGLRARAERGDTILAGTLPDQAALHGILAQIESLGLVLLEVRHARSRRTDRSSESSASDDVDSSART